MLLLSEKEKKRQRTEKSSRGVKELYSDVYTDFEVGYMNILHGNIWLYTVVI
jgi:hypothetical protein